MKPRVSVVIPNYNGIDYLENCVESLLKQDVCNFEIIIVDDCSKDDSFEQTYEKYKDKTGAPEIRFIKRTTNGGFCKSVNDGIKHSKAEYVLLLNNDTEVDVSFVKNMYKAIKDKKHVFSVSAKMVSLHNKNIIDDTGDLYCLLGWAFTPSKDKDVAHYNKKAKVFAGCGGACIYRKDVFDKIGLFDENHFAYLEDIDIGYRSKLYGYENMYEPTAICYHAGSAVTGSRHNDFKVSISARNNLYLIYKNMPTWQIVLNFPWLVAGTLIKIVYFTKKGLGGSYIKGLKQGVQLCTSFEGKGCRVNFSKIPVKNLLNIELQLFMNTVRRVLG